MSWSDSHTGKVIGPTRKSDFDRVFDNQQQLALEFSKQHAWATTGATTGYHSAGVSAASGTGSFTSVGTDSILTTPLAALISGGVWMLTLFFWRDDTHTAFHQLLVNDRLTTLDIVVYFNAVTSCGVGHTQSAAVEVGTVTPASCAYFHVYVDASENLVVDFYRNTTDAHHYYYALTQLNKAGV